MTPPIVWQPHAPALVVAAAMIAAIAVVALRARRLRTRFGGRVAAAMAAPAAVALALVVTALLDPALPARTGEPRRVLVLVDASSSMDVRDGPAAGEAARRARAERIASALAADGAKVERRWFDTAVHDAAPTAAGERGTDLGACLQSLAPTVAAGDVAGIVVVSDGGDEAVASDGLPSCPIATIAVGADADRLDDLAIAAVTAPDGAEKDLDCEISVDAVATGSADFRARVGVVPAILEAADGQQWKEIQRQPLDLANGRARATFRVKPTVAGTARFRVALPAVPGEASTLDNARAVDIDVREKALHVLYFSRTLGLDFKPLRAELARDPGLSLTALYRTVGARLGGGGERFTVQGDRLAGDDDLDGGFPDDAAKLKRYDCVILGSFAADTWPEAQQRALAAYVDGGGALVALGGEASFGVGGYARSPLAALMPWQIADGEPAPLRGEYALAVPPIATSHPAVAGVAERLAQTRASVASLNRPGPLRGGAVPLMTAVADGGEVAVCAGQPYGKGRVLGVASDTLWRLARADEAGGGAYGLFWRQAVRWLADRGEGGGSLRVRWDRARYRPGETAIATVRTETSARVSAVVEGPSAERRELPAMAAPGEAGALRVEVPFGARGDWRVRIVATRDDGAAETYERVFAIAPLLPEGARLARDDAGLKRLAEAHAGVAVGEEHVDDLGPWLAQVARPRIAGETRSLVFATPWWLAALVATMLVDWTLRRRRNLV